MLNTRQVRLGDSATLSQNFIISAPAVPDGTMSIARESGTHVLDIDVNGKVTFPGNVQTWQDVKASRALGGGPYTNATGQRITVMIEAEGTTSTSSAQLIPTVAGTVLPKSMNYIVAGNAGWYVTLQFDVPAGATYSVSQVQASLAPAGAKWMELR